MTSKDFFITREKHLDHMVRVVPFIVAAYAVQCYFIMQLGPSDFAVDGLFFLGAMLVLMISSFVSYDLTHVVNFHETTLTIKIRWLRYERSICYEDISKIDVPDPGQTFSTVLLHTKDGKKYGFYFVDDADKIKTWLEQKRAPKFQAAA